MGRKAAALILTPSMDMIAGILLIAVTPYGVTSAHIREWIGNGSLPLLNAFRLLTKDQQKSLESIANFFRSKNVPPALTLQKIVRNLHVACGFKPRKVMIKKMIEYKPEEAGEEADYDQELTESKVSRLFKPGAMITVSTVPLIATRYVADLGLGQKVLNFSLALMGLPIVRKSNIPMEEGHSAYVRREQGGEDAWLPEPLKAARPDRLLRPSNILAVIVVACKLLPDWQKHSFKRPLAFCLDENTEEVDSPESIIHESLTSSKRRRITKRFLPRTQDQFRFLGNGGLTKDYLDFLEEEVVDTSRVELPGFVSSLKFERRSDSGAKETQEVLPCSTFLRIDHQPYKIPRVRLHFFRYELTENVKVPIAPPLGPLIELMAQKFELNPTHIVAYVVELDKEMKTIGNTTRTVKMTPEEAFQKIMKS